MALHPSNPTQLPRHRTVSTTILPPHLLLTVTNLLDQYPQTLEIILDLTGHRQRWAPTRPTALLHLATHFLSGVCRLSKLPPVGIPIHSRRRRQVPGMGTRQTRSGRGTEFPGCRGLGCLVSVSLSMFFSVYALRFYIDITHCSTNLHSIQFQKNV